MEIIVFAERLVIHKHAVISLSLQRVVSEHYVAGQEAI